MKTRSLLTALLVTATLCLYAKEAKAYPPVDSHIEKFVGVWIGETQDADGSLRTWVQNRAADGTFLIVFVTFKDNTVTRSVQSGKWWIEKGRFFETIQEESPVHEYAYTINPDSPGQISFKDVASDYSFTDCKIPGGHRAVLNEKH